MIPWKTHAKAKGPDGRELLLQERDGTFVIRVGGVELMSSARHGSEEAMADASVKHETRHVLIGGLGLGYTLRATLDRLDDRGTVVVAEISAAVVEWNRGPVKHLAGEPLEDPRVQLEVKDVRKCLPGKPTYDAILLDVDNGPSALSAKANEHLYGLTGLAALHGSLKKGGVLVVWSASPSPRFVAQLKDFGFLASERPVSPTGKGGGRHVLFVAEKR